MRVVFDITTSSFMNIGRTYHCSVFYSNACVSQWHIILIDWLTNNSHIFQGESLKEQSTVINEKTRQINKLFVNPYDR